jgi:hypothetical protein
MSGARRARWGGGGGGGAHVDMITGSARKEYGVTYAVKDGEYGTSFR